MPPSYSLLSPAAARAGIADGSIDAVLAASPSAVRRIADLAPLHGCRLVAIGRSTAEQAAALGLQVAAVAAEPTPEGLADAVGAALGTAGPAGAPNPNLPGTT
ncbi:uroporphyrinogen-III synthase [Arthrobacter sp. SD76]|uniref:uroporphyrinogen-III synthase n=1 Tax=Arthrobacter sp. SD76 TaxID=3415007 RepID=UPI003C70FEA2